MATVKHHGTGVALMEGAIDVNETRWLWFSWPSAVSSSEWILPAGWALEGAQIGSTVIGDNGKAHKNCNGALIKPAGPTGNYLVTNRCVLENGEALDRTVQIKLRVL
mgnify:CR=1 FL=1